MTNALLTLLWCGDGQLIIMLEVIVIIIIFKVFGTSKAPLAVLGAFQSLFDQLERCELYEIQNMERVLAFACQLESK